MVRLLKSILLMVPFFCITTAHAQRGESGLNIFGYFQVSLTQEATTDGEHKANTFNVQQLNLFLQKDLGSKWTSLVNFELVNNYSSDKFWGAFNLEEAWVRYRARKELNVKVGLQIPEFNHLNKINNRTPLLPYIVRPLVYETSLSEIIAIEHYVPARAFVQAYGFIPKGEAKFDYAFYVGNSPDIANRRGAQLSGLPQQTGVDTTDTFLFGGRLGVRLGELKVGISGTYEKGSFPREFADSLGVPVATTQERPRTRFGADISHRVGRFSLESEYIKVGYNVDIPQLGLRREFYYGTLGYDVTDRLFAYVSYWNTRDILVAKSGAIDFGENLEVAVPTVGTSYRVNDRISVKAQYAYVSVTINIPGVSSNFNHVGAAVSVFF